MTLQRYRIYTAEAEPGYVLCEHKDGDVVKASEHEAEIAALKKRIEELETENTQLRDHLYLINVLQESK